MEVPPVLRQSRSEGMVRRVISPARASASKCQGLVPTNPTVAPIPAAAATSSKWAAVFRAKAGWEPKTAAENDAAVARSGDTNSCHDAVVGRGSAGWATRYSSQVSRSPSWSRASTSQEETFQAEDSRVSKVQSGAFSMACVRNPSSASSPGCRCHHQTTSKPNSSPAGHGAVQAPGGCFPCTVTMNPMATLVAKSSSQASCQTDPSEECSLTSSKTPRASSLVRGSS
mmetsp:Transcript_53902/g.122693  ORF Transcript_53902/g.122693 Transcript_53902/m.122693 type:complete len:228 (-) Transcript_53902:209-892(-)